MQPHRSSALHGAAAALTVARTRGVAVPLPWSWSHQPLGRAPRVSGCSPVHGEKSTAPRVQLTFAQIE